MNRLGYARIGWNRLEWAVSVTGWNMMEYGGMGWNRMEWAGMSWNRLEYAGKLWNGLRYARID